MIWAGPTDPIPITIRTASTNANQPKNTRNTHAYGSYQRRLLVGARARQCMCGSI